jgi:hypothetical protein
MKQHAFNQEEVLMLGRTKQQKEAAWGQFSRICNTFDISVRVTGGLLLTHQVDCGEDDFNALLELVIH